MPTRGNRTTVRHALAGGWATDFGPSANVSERSDGMVEIPFLVNAENVEYGFDGWPRKMGGTQKLNTTAIEAATAVRGIFDYWKMGSGGSSVQKRIAHVGTKIYKDDADGSFAEIGSGFTADAVPSYATFEDIVIISNDSSDVPQKYDQTGSVATIGTNTPNFAFGVTHKNRFWAAGVDANSSRLYYSPSIGTNNGADGDWDGASSGFLDIDPGDGDRLTGLVSHKNELWVFKGPNSGSIHRVGGSAPTGSDGFNRLPFVYGIGAIAHNLIFRFRSDVGFMGIDGTVHSLAATAAFGDYQEATLSRPINGWLRAHLNLDRCKYGTSATNVSRGRVFFTLPIDASSFPNTTISMDFQFANSLRWAYPKDYSLSCVATVIDQTDNNQPAFMGGGSDGFVRKLLQADRSIDGLTSYASRATFPHIDYGTPHNLKTISAASVGIQPRGAYPFTFGWTRDDNAQQTETVDQSGADVLSGARLWIVVAGIYVDEVFTISSIPAHPHGAIVGDTIVLVGHAAGNGTYKVNGIISDISLTIEVAPGVINGAGSPAYYFTDVSNPFILGTSALGGARFATRFMELHEGGKFRSIQYELLQDGLNEDFEPHSLSATITRGSDSLEN